MKMQDKFEHSLDVYANIICLCPLCHKRIHFGVKKDRQLLITKLYNERAERLVNSGLDINREEFVKMAMM